MNLSGIYPPIATPFKNDEVDYAGLSHNVRRWMGTGLRGLLALGSNGEAAFVDEDEAERIIATVREGVPADRVLLAGTGRQSTRATIAATKRAAGAGADAVLVLTPFYFKAQMTHDALADHYRAVADASPVPVLLYNFTNVTGINMTPDTVAALSAHPNIVGLKDSNGDVAQVAAVVARVPAGFTVLVGSAATLYPAMVMGAAGGIVAAANVVPDVCVKLYDLVRAGKHDEARVLQRTLTPLANAVTGGYSIPGLKVAMEIAGYVGGDVRQPLRPAKPEARDVLQRLYEELVG
ncbi:MAG: dihydrodipicolinate synthase family protein [Vicinamibacterales bacterium]|jgi:4-hydroxy-2-oxoglutarate aldolase|nr:dihydrodipicolinate synthase family protein [Vicinamibacterales bacterium]